MENRVKFVRNHIEIQLEHATFHLSIEEMACEESLIIHKEPVDDNTVQIRVGAKCANEIEVF